MKATIQRTHPAILFATLFFSILMTGNGIAAHYRLKQVPEIVRTARTGARRAGRRINEIFEDNG